MSWPKKLLFGLITTLGFWLLAEALLAIAGFEPTTTTTDPLLGFSRQVPLLESYQAENGIERVQTAAGKLVWFNHQSFPAIKPDRTRRVFCVGGSTTYGRPFADGTSYSGWLRELLPLADPDTNWEVINAGGVSYASYRVAEVMQELSQYEPDLFLVYSVHNEFLERRTYEGLFETSVLNRNASAILQKTRVGSLVQQFVSSSPINSNTKARLSEEVDERLNHTVGPSDYHRDDVWQTKVIRHYEWNLERMVSIAQRSGAQIAFITPASNLKDCWPFKSESNSQSPTTPSGLSQLDKVKASWEQSDDSALVTQTNAIINSDPRCAEAHFFHGRALFQMEEFDQAEVAFLRAIDEDVCPLRATTAIAETVRRVARRHEIPLIDFETKLRQYSQERFGHSCFGRELFLDHVHPTIEVHGELAWWILEELQRTRVVGGSLPSETQKVNVQQKVFDLVDDQTRGIAFRNLAKVMHWAGKFPEAAQHAADALKLIPDDLESRFLLADCELCQGRNEESLRLYDELFDVGDFPRAYVNYAELLFEAGRLDEAKSYLIPAVLRERHRRRERAMYLLALVHLSLEEYEFALECFNQLDPAYANDSDMLFLKAEAYAGAGDQQAAIEALTRLTKSEPVNFEARYRLAVALVSQQRPVDARHQLEKAREIDPTDPRLEAITLQIQALEESLSEK
ncbi:tetratricopeptide repeat protein [Neorhodopirellula pilleata]|uniref:tetratricopeptide repeat protein n=1 Tax=Neorhodopirellula pilleata TaxID=2714738 RepID=UPI0011B5E82A|nr:tetratricopeptide repeat protein [Neorhodopirellula pilleata]